jgi:hypothetical protein
MKKIISLLILILTFSFINAQTDQCKKYADKAVKQYQLAKTNNISGTDGLGWSSDWNAHYNWCKTVPINIANAENTKRQKIIDKYLSPNQNSDTQYCNKYADKAVKQYQLAKKNNLPNINWPLWSDDWNEHLNWCQTVSPEVADKESAKRLAYLDKYIKENKDIQIDDATLNILNDMVNNQLKYKIKKQSGITTQANSKQTISEHYAKESVRQNKENISNNCGFKGSSWSSDFNYHKNWCLHGDNYLQIDRILADREKQLKTCKNDSTIWIPQMLLGLRKSKKGSFPYQTDPLFNYLLKKGINPVLGHVRDETSESSIMIHGISRGWDWISVEKGNYKKADQYHLPPGVVIDLQHTMDNKPVGIFGIVSIFKNAPESIGRGNFHKKCGGDLGAPPGEGLCWYESTGLNFTDWSQVDKLPKGTVVGLKHNGNQPNKKLIWQDRVYDPTNINIQPPPGFIRIDGGDWGGPSGKGFCWYEKITENIK